jgi:hypothetical protein
VIGIVFTREKIGGGSSAKSVDVRWDAFTFMLSEE